MVSLVAAILAAMASAQSPPASQTISPATKTSLGPIAPSGAFVAELTKSLDAKKAKTNQPIEARLTMDVLSHGEIAIPRGTRIIGHITAAKAQTKEVPGSIVEVAFDRIVLKNKREIPLQATIQAVGAPTQTFASEASSDMDLTGSQLPLGKNAMKHHISSAYPSSLHSANSTSSSPEPVDRSGPHSNPVLGPASRGVVGIKGIGVSNTAHGSTIRSASGNLHLSSGTQLVLRVFEPQVLFDSIRSPGS